MSKILSVSIDVTKIDKSKLIQGKKGTYANLQISVNDEKDQFGNDCSVWISQTKEERESKTPKQYLGNGKIVWSSGGQSAPGNSSVDDSLPF